MSKFESRKIGPARNQSAVPVRKRPFDSYNAQGLLLRGVVTKTYVKDSADHPYADLTPTAIYCDVLCYSSMKGMTFRFLPGCIVSQDRGALHSGRIWKPRAATIELNGDYLNLEHGTDPNSIDGDHVLVGFLNNDYSQPVVIKGLSHPAVDVGNEENDAGDRMQLKEADGDPDFWRHHGVYYGVDDSGDFVIDTRRAWSGNELASNGAEPAAAEDGTTGNQILRLPKGSKVTIEIEDGATITIENKDADAKMTLGVGDVSVAVADHLETLYGTLKSTFDDHTHPDSFGGTGQTTTPAPAWDLNINSDKLLIPDTDT